MRSKTRQFFRWVAGLRFFLLLRDMGKSKRSSTEIWRGIWAERQQDMTRRRT